MKYTSEYWNDVNCVLTNIPNLQSIFGKKVLITGATGMVCSSVVELIAYLNDHYDAGIQLLLAGRSIERIEERFGIFLKQTDYRFIEFDATRPQQVDVDVDYIIHGAGNADPTIYSTHPVETMMGNINGLTCMLDLAKSRPNSRLLFVSSSEVYGKRYSGSSKPYMEDEYGYVDLLNPRACYPNGKRASETLCACYSQEFDVDVVIVRLGHIYGPTIRRTDTRASAAFTWNVVDGQNIVMKSAGSQLRSYCYSLDCASAILAVLINGERNEAYNISNRNSIASIRDMAEALAEAGGCKVVFENPSDQEKRGFNLMENSALDSDKIEGLGWKAVFDIRSGAAKTLKFI